MIRGIKIFLKIMCLVLLNITVFANSEEYLFSNVGNMKIIKPLEIQISREDIKITIEKDNKINIETNYMLHSDESINAKVTYLFPLDIKVLNGERKKINQSNEFIEKLRVYDDYKEVKPSMAYIVFEDENKQYVHREWRTFISTILMKKREKNVKIDYTLKNITSDFKYNFSINSNFKDNKANILLLSVENKSTRKIKSIIIKNDEIKQNEQGIYEYNVADFNLKDELKIIFE